jgi:hypothetical protein
MKTPSTDTERLRSTLQLAVLDALMSARRWAPSEIAFQGGTSLRFVHTSPRYSEDLDFLVRDGIRLERIEAAIAERLGQPAWLKSKQTITVSTAKDGKNPLAFDVKIRGPGERDVAAHVKVELYQTPAAELDALSLVVRPVALSTGALAGAAIQVPTLTAQEIYADKVFALVARKYLKPRDVFDLDWLPKHAEVTAPTSEDLARRFAIYPGTTPADWLAAAAGRRSELSDPGRVPLIENDLRRWLPTSWPLNSTSVAGMMQRAVASIDAATPLVAALAAAEAAPQDSLDGEPEAPRLG